MKRDLEIREIGIGLRLAANESASGQSLHALRRSGVFPTDWKPMDDTVAPQLYSSFSFDNGVQFLSTENEVWFGQVMGPDPKVEPLLVARVIEYLKYLGDRRYSEVIINLKGHVGLQGEDPATNGVLGWLSKLPTWSNSKSTPTNMALDLSYEFEDTTCLVRVQRRSFTEIDGVTKPVMAFFADFTHNLWEAEPIESIAKARTVVENWRADETRYREIVDHLAIWEDQS